MDEADLCSKDIEPHLNEALAHRKPEGPRPLIVALCVNCGEVIERIPCSPEAFSKARRFCCRECCSEWEKTNGRDSFANECGIEWHKE